ncbi:hypothetical protein TNCV_4565591 [Trichonephila clavipes]|nr:hypothetical protein TNCV_4565591 [Trichonephila clavipes]
MRASMWARPWARSQFTHALRHPCRKAWMESDRWRCMRVRPHFRHGQHACDEYESLYEHRAGGYSLYLLPSRRKLTCCSSVA